MRSNTTNATWDAIAARTLAGATGVGIIGTVAHYATMASGGYGWDTSAPMYFGLAAGLVVGATAIGYCLRDRRYLLAGLTAVALVAGEGNSLLNTSERVLEARDQKAAPIRAAHAEREAFRVRIETAASRLEGWHTNPRIAAAEQAKAAADKAIADNAGGAQCKQHCKDMLLKSQAAAALEVTAARAAFEVERTAAREALNAQRKTFKQMPVPASDSPLADRLGWKGWVVDLVAAALLSIAANGLGAFLVAFATHGAHAPRQTTVLEVAAPANDLEPGPGTPLESNDKVVDWVRAHRARWGRDPQIPEVMKAHPEISRTTAWRRIKAA